jgi:hypothetical protein
MDTAHDWTPSTCLAAAAVVSLLAVALAGCGSAGNLLRDNGQQAAEGTPVTTPGPQARYVQQVVTAAGVDPNGGPVRPTTRFHAQVPVYLVGVVQGVGSGESHRLSVRWLVNGALVQEAGAHASMIVTHDSSVSFSLAYPTPGAGMARLYWDEPVGDNNDAANERFLAQAISFTVE